MYAGVQVLQYFFFGARPVVAVFGKQLVDELFGERRNRGAELRSRVYLHSLIFWMRPVRFSATKGFWLEKSS